MGLLKMWIVMMRMPIFILQLQIFLVMELTRTVMVLMLKAMTMMAMAFRHHWLWWHRSFSLPGARDPCGWYWSRLWWVWRCSKQRYRWWRLRWWRWLSAVWPFDLSWRTRVPDGIDQTVMVLTILFRSRSRWWWFPTRDWLWWHRTWYLPKNLKLLAMGLIKTDGVDGVSGECSSFEAEDCNGNCAPLGWLVTVSWWWTYQYNGYGVDFSVKTLTMMMVIVQLVSIMMEMDLQKTRTVMIQTLQSFKCSRSSEWWNRPRLWWTRFNRTLW